MNLRKKSIFTGLTKASNIILSFVVQILLTPFILSSLGKELFGVFSLINKLQNYLSIIDFRPTAILRFKLAATQTENDSDERRRYIGATIIVAITMMPIMILFGWLLSFFFEDLFIIDSKYISLGQIAIIILSIYMGVKALLGIPEAIIRGNNEEYKLIFAEPIRLLFYSICVYLFLKMGYGLIGVILSIVLAGIIDFIFKIFIQKKLYPKLTPLLAKKDEVKEFFSKGSWYLVSSISTQIINTLDIIIIGITIGVKSVTIYSLSKSMLFRVSESFSIVLGGMTSSIGFLVGEGNIEKLANIRYRLLRYNLIIGGLILGYFVIFNNSFITLWVDSSNFVGQTANIFLCLGGLFTLLCLSNEIFINSFQLFKSKSVILMIVVVVFVVSSYLLITHYGLVGIAMSLAFSKFLQLLLYEFFLQKYVKLEFKEFLIQNLKTMSLIALFFLLEKYLLNIGSQTWFMFIFYSLVYFIVYSILTIFYILEIKERNYLFKILKSKLHG